MEVTVKELRKPAIVYIFRIAVCNSLTTVGVASVAKCCRQNSPNFAFAGSCTILLLSIQPKYLSHEAGSTVFVLMIMYSSSSSSANSAHILPLFFYC